MDIPQQCYARRIRDMTSNIDTILFDKNLIFLLMTWKQKVSLGFEIFNEANIVWINSTLIHQKSKIIVTSYISPFELYDSRERRVNNRGSERSQRKWILRIISTIIANIRTFSHPFHKFLRERGNQLNTSHLLWSNITHHLYEII